MTILVQQQLRELCDKATQGDWWIDSHGRQLVAHNPFSSIFITHGEAMGPATRHPETGYFSHWPNDWDASYIVAVQPKVVRGLLDEIERLQADNQELKSAKHTIECRFEVSEDTLSCIRGCLRAAEGDIDQLKAENAELKGDVEKAWAAANSECRDWAQEYERRIAAQGQINQLSLQNAELIDLMRRVVAEHPRHSHKNDGNGPGHGHAIPGVWDEDNGELAGKPCAWCSIWNAAKGIVERHEQAIAKEQQP